MKALLPFIIFGTLASQALAQQPSTPAEAKTKLQLFEASSGVVLVHGSSTIGTITGLFNSTAEVECKELAGAVSGQKQYGITVAVQSAPPDDKQRIVAYVDYDELDPLIKGIDSLSKADKSVTKLDRFQVDYKTRDDLRVSIFSDRDGNIQASISSGTISSNVSMFVSVDQLTEFKGLIQKAKDKLDSIQH